MVNSKNLFLIGTGVLVIGGLAWEVGDLERVMRGLVWAVVGGFARESKRYKTERRESFLSLH